MIAQQSTKKLLRQLKKVFPTWAEAPNYAGNKFMESKSALPPGDQAYREKLRTQYLACLLDDVMPFWERHSLDREHGGYLSCLDRDGTVVDTDKSVWVQGRMAWMFSSLHLRIEARPEWLEYARLGIDFLEQHCFAPDGKMFFLVTRDGKPLRMRRHFFSEAFAAIAFAAFARAAGSRQHADRAMTVFQSFMDRATGKIFSEPKWDQATRPQVGMALPMIALRVAQEIRGHLPEATDQANAAIDWAITSIRELFYKPDLRALLEIASPDGGVIDSFDGRTLNPGHSLEAAWFLMAEARHRQDAALLEMALNITDWMWERGWDTEYGGLLYFTSLDEKPVQEYWHDMKFWWPHNEAELAALMAWDATGNPRYRVMLEKIHDYQFDLFPDPEHGEWFGYMHRDGRRSSTLKGNQWKSAFHIPRMLLEGALVLGVGDRIHR